MKRLTRPFPLLLLLLTCHLRAFPGLFYAFNLAEIKNACSLPVQLEGSFSVFGFLSTQNLPNPLEPTFC